MSFVDVEINNSLRREYLTEAEWRIYASVI